MCSLYSHSFQRTPYRANRKKEVHDDFSVSSPANCRDGRTKSQQPRTLKSQMEKSPELITSIFDFQVKFVEHIAMHRARTHTHTMEPIDSDCGGDGQRRQFNICCALFDATAFHLVRVCACDTYDSGAPSARSSGQTYLSHRIICLLLTRLLFMTFARGTMAAHESEPTRAHGQRQQPRRTFHFIVGNLGPRRILVSFLFIHLWAAFVWLPRYKTAFKQIR